MCRDAVTRLQRCKKSSNVTGPNGSSIRRLYLARCEGLCIIFTFTTLKTGFKYLLYTPLFSFIILINLFTLTNIIIEWIQVRRLSTWNCGVNSSHIRSVYHYYNLDLMLAIKWKLVKYFLLNYLFFMRNSTVLNI